MSARAAMRPARVASQAGVRVRRALVAEIGVLAAILSYALYLRLTGLSDPTDLSDEGIRGVQLRLLAAGFRPVSEIYASQGPLSLWLFWPSVALFGPDIYVARLTVAAYSLATILATGWLARSVAGPLAGLAAAAILAASPVFLDNSRLAFVEVPSIAPTVVSLVLLLAFRRSGHRGWLIASAVMLAIGTLAKPMAAVAALPALLLILAPPSTTTGPDPSTSPTTAPGRRPFLARLLHLGLYGLVGALICAAVVLAVGPQTLYDQMVAYRLGARAIRGWDLATNARLVADQVMLNGWGVLLAALLGAVGVILLRRSPGLAMLAWLVGATAALLAYSPLWEKHVSYLMPPLAILAAVGIAGIGPLLARRWSPLAVALGVPALAALALIAAYVPTLSDEHRAIMHRHAGDDFARYADDLLIVQAATSPGDFVVVDDAYLSMLTGRLTPPFLADLSWNRILARALTADQAIAETRRFDTRILIVQDDHLGQIQRYLTWADKEYVLVKSYVQRKPARFRRLYANPSLDLTAARDALRASLAQPTEVTVGPAALLGFELEKREIKTGSRVDLTVMFEALQSKPPEHALITRLRDAAGDVAWEGEWKVGDGGQELHTWPQGRWQAQTMRLLVDDVREGAYTLTIQLQRPNGGPARVDVRSGARAYGRDGEVDLGPVRVVK